MTQRAKLVAQGIAIGLVALLFLLLVWALVTEEGGGLAASAARGDKPEAPDFTLERLDEEGELTLSSLRGKAVLVNIWASWCHPCKEEAPILEQVWQRLPEARARRRRRGHAGLPDATAASSSARTASRSRSCSTAPGSSTRRTARRAARDLRRRPRGAPRGRDRRRRDVGGRPRAARRRDGARARVVISRAALVLVVALAGCRRCARRRSAARGRSRGGARVPGVRHDARPVDRAGRRAHEALHPPAHRRRGQRAGDQGRARRRVRARGSRASA